MTETKSVEQANNKKSEAGHDRDTAHSSFELLILTDQVNSSELTLHKLKKATKIHFEEFIKALPGYTQIIKNVGDSLMIKAEIDNPDIDIPLLLIAINDAKRIVKTAMTNEDDKEIPIRVLIMMLHNRNDEYCYGQQIKYQHNTQTKAKFRCQNHANWLHDDLFGPNVTLAFRAAGIISGDIIAIQDEVVKKLGNYKKRKLFKLSVFDNTLIFGPSLAFSPFKGLEDRYPFSNITADDSRNFPEWWPGHLYLREVNISEQKCKTRITEKNKKDNISKNIGFNLLFDQQKFIVITELVWFNDVDKDLDPWNIYIKRINGSSNYIKSFSKIINHRIYTKRPKLGIDKNKGFIMVGAYPNEKTYGAVRDLLEKEDNSYIEKTKYIYPITNIVYQGQSPGSKHKSTEVNRSEIFWEPKQKLDNYLLLLARWKSPLRFSTKKVTNDTLDDTIIKINKISKLSKINLEIINSGLIVGPQWDLFSIIKINNLNQNIDKIINKLGKSLLENGIDIGMCQAFWDTPGLKLVYTGTDFSGI